MTMMLFKPATTIVAHIVWPPKDLGRKGLKTLTTTCTFVGAILVCTTGKKGKAWTSHNILVRQKGKSWGKRCGKVKEC